MSFAKFFFVVLSINTMYNGWVNNYVFVLGKQRVLMDSLVLSLFKHRRNRTQGICFFANGIGIFFFDFDSYFELSPKTTPVEGFNEGILSTSNIL